MEKMDYKSDYPTHNYTYYHRCSGEVTVTPSGGVIVTSDCESPTRDPYHTDRFNREMTVEEALSLFRHFDHNGAGRKLRKILKSLM